MRHFLPSTWRLKISSIEKISKSYEIGQILAFYSLSLLKLGEIANFILIFKDFSLQSVIHPLGNAGDLGRKLVLRNEWENNDFPPSFFITCFLWGSCVWGTVSHFSDGNFVWIWTTFQNHFLVRMSKLSNYLGGRVFKLPRYLGREVCKSLNYLGRKAFKLSNYLGREIFKMSNNNFKHSMNQVIKLATSVFNMHFFMMKREYRIFQQNTIKP